MRKIAFSLAGLAVVILACFFLTDEGICQTAPFLNKQFIPGPVAPEFSPEFSYPILPFRDVPPAPVHSCAEWEESEGIIINYNWMNADTIYQMQLEHQVYVQVNDQAEVDNYIAFLNANSIPHTNIHFIMIPCTYRWMRDCGPWFIWDGNNELCIVNNTCWNGSHPLDDLFPKEFAKQYGYKYYEPEFKIYGEGGNYYPNAYGIAFATSCTYQVNSEKSKGFLDSLFKDYLGIDYYQTCAPATLFHHDTCSKPADPETLIIVQWPEDHYKHPIGEGIFALYETLESPWGRPYKIHRLPMFPMVPGDFKPYMNCLCANKKVFVPITHTPDDDIALGIIGEAFEGYEIVGTDSHGSGWGASLHCATKLIMKRDIIRIYPYPPGDTEDTTTGYAVTAEVITLSGSTLLPGYPVIHWTDTGGAPFNDVAMLPTGQANEYEAEIPAQPKGTTVSFYIEARDEVRFGKIRKCLSFPVSFPREAPRPARGRPWSGPCARMIWPPPRWWWNTPSTARLSRMSS
ncbi:MAG: agmatine deiminase family protein [Planctomycetota bacterium]|jgi:agmatine/peptidylarginine deiminase